MRGEFLETNTELVRQWAVAVERSDAPFARLAPLQMIAAAAEAMTKASYLWRGDFRAAPGYTRDQWFFAANSGLLAAHPDDDVLAVLREKLKNG